jgi:hypothetical protein
VRGGSLIADGSIAFDSSSGDDPMRLKRLFAHTSVGIGDVVKISTDELDRGEEIELAGSGFMDSISLCTLCISGDLYSHADLSSSDNCTSGAVIVAEISSFDRSELTAVDGRNLPESTSSSDFCVDSILTEFPPISRAGVSAGVPISHPISKDISHPISKLTTSSSAEVAHQRVGSAGNIALRTGP